MAVELQVAIAARVSGLVGVRLGGLVRLVDLVGVTLRVSVGELVEVSVSVIVAVIVRLIVLLFVIKGIIVAAEDCVEADCVELGLLVSEDVSVILLVSV